MKNKFKEWNSKSGYSISCILPGRSNVFLLSSGTNNILIDTSPGYKWKKLKSTLKALGINKLDHLILTHTHYDHAENASKIKTEFSAKVIVNKHESGCLEKGATIIPHGTIFITQFIVNYLAPLFPSKFNYEPCHPDIITDQRFDLNEFGFNAYILHTPGHSQGSQSVIIDDEICLTGDAMFGIFPGSIFPPFADNEDELIKSWGKLLHTGCTIFLPSHGTANKVELVRKEYEKYILL
jgi:glyoxylase-like metal-dependent hydrolase (beta-lactamase superfamily II)